MQAAFYPPDPNPAYSRCVLHFSFPWSFQAPSILMLQCALMSVPDHCYSGGLVYYLPRQRDAL